MKYLDIENKILKNQGDLYKAISIADQTNLYNHVIYSCGIRHILLLFLLTVLNVTLFASNFKVIETSSQIDVATKNYSINIDKTSFAFKVSNSESEIMQTSAELPFFFKKNDTAYSLDKLLSIDDSGDTLKLNYATTYAGENIKIEIIFKEDHFIICTKATGINDKMGYNILLQNGAQWYGGNITSAQNWPSNASSFEVDPFYSNSNQTSPIWLCSKGTGLFVDTYNTMGYSFNKDGSNLFSFHVKNTPELRIKLTVGKTITDAYKSMAEIIGKPQVIPPKEYFSQAIFNSWIEFGTNVNQTGLLNYANEIRQRQMPCKILEIDDKWTPAYGEFDFDLKKFPNPLEMTKTLKSQDFKTALWVTPFVEKKASTYKFLASKGFLILDPQNNKPYFTTWWNGSAALIDLSNPEAYNWFVQQLKTLQDKYGVNGFKLDAGDAEYLSKPFKSMGNITAIQYTDLFASVGKYFEINELRVSWLTQPLGLVQRLRDKSTNWSSDAGIGSLVPHGMAEGLIGYPYFCPDMIGGGEIGSFKDNKESVDIELFIRWAEASTFMPMMQYSLAPWKLDSNVMAICFKYTRIHEQLGDYIYSLAQNANENGDPIVLPLFYNNPEDSITYTISDEFMLGNKFLVAPVLTKGSTSRSVYLPKGTWVDFWNGDIFKGNQMLNNYSAPIEKLPVFINIINN